jgi:serine/threonine protein kinase
MSSGIEVLLRIFLIMAAVTIGFYLFIKLLMALGWITGVVGRGVSEVGSRVGNFVGGMISDVVRLAGGVVTGAVFIPMVVFNVALGRWSRANHYGRALEREGTGIAKASWRLVLGHPARLFGLDSLIEGVESRIPEAMARAPGPDTPSGRPDAFDGYRITGSLPAGGSGARLFLAEPTLDKRRQLSGTGLTVPDRVVIKSFSLHDGSTMPQIVRESRALEAARNLGLVLEHNLQGTRFHYVMPFVPGEDLGVVTQRLHAESGQQGLGERQLQQVMSHTSDLLGILHRFHANGLWHKDVKPTNIIVSGGKVELVDLGLTTPLASAMTLTTHGTEYFRDPELVRLAMRGVKVHEVDGVKFDVYGVGAVLFSMIENSFPAHGSLSLITRKCPEALRWIVRRSMADLGSRYASTADVLADLRVVMAARDPHKVKPAQLPSMAGRPDLVEALDAELAAVAGGSPMPRPRVQATLAKSKTVHREKDVAARTGRGSMALGVLAAGVLLLVAMGAVFALFSTTGARLIPAPNEARIIPGSHQAEGTIQLSSAGTRSGRPVMPDPAPVRDWSAHRPQPAPVLLVTDVPDAASELSHDWVDGILNRLEGARFAFVGEGREHDLGVDREISLVAKARKTMGLSDPQDPETMDRLNAFVTLHGDELDGLLWIGRAGDSPDELTWRFFFNRDQDGDDVVELLGASKMASQDSTGEFNYSIY